MALEAVNFQQDWLGYNSKDQWSYDFGLEKQELFKGNFEYFLDNQTSSEINDYFVHGDWVVSSSPTPSMAAAPPPDFSDHHHQQLHQHQCPNSSMDAANYANGSYSSALDASTTTCTRPKRRRSKTRKNKQEIENQRMTHIAVERNRRKQMKEYISVLQSLMPESYVQRGDQASIIGGAINYVKELEHRLQWLSAEKEGKGRSDISGGNSSSSSSSPFAEFFTFPQYSTSTTLGVDHNKDSLISMNDKSMVVETQSAIADIEVTMVESHANLKIRSKRQAAELLKVVTGLNSLRLSILHLNVTTVHQTVLYSLSVKVEDDCQLSSVDDIATAVNQLLGRIQEDHMLC